jgi:hypothetical protein
MKKNPLTSFFWFCAGVYRQGLERYPALHAKYVGIGATVFFTGLFASLSGGYALYFVFSGSEGAVWKALLFGILWGLAIFNLDRYLVSTLYKIGPLWRQFLQATPRLLLAILIGIVVARPLELKLFEKEIDERLRITLQQRHQDELLRNQHLFDQKYTMEINRLQTLKSQKDTLITHIQEETTKLKQETFGTRTAVTSGIIGFGPYAKERQATIHKQELLLDSLRRQIESEEQALFTLKSQEGLTLQPLLHTSSLDSAIAIAGFADRNATLAQLAYFEDGTADQATQQALWFISLLFIFFECLPVLVKLMSPRDAYDQYLSHLHEKQNYQLSQKLIRDKRVIDVLQEEKTYSKVDRKRKALMTSEGPIAD